MSEHRFVVPCPACGERHGIPATVLATRVTPAGGAAYYEPTHTHVARCLVCDHRLTQAEVVHLGWSCCETLDWREAVHA